MMAGEEVRRRGTKGWSFETGRRIGLKLGRLVRRGERSMSM